MPAASSNTINLISTKTGLSPQIERVAGSLRRAASIAMMIFILSGVTIGSVYYYYYSRRNSLTLDRDQLRNQISAAKNKEGLLVSIKDRTRIVEKVMKSQRPLGEILDLLGRIAVPPLLTNVSIDESSKIEATIQANTLDEIVPPIEAVIAYAQDGKVKAPELRSVQIGKNGIVTMVLAFNAIFK